MLHTYFSKSFLINLDRRPDRLAEATRECAKIGLAFERFAARDGRTLPGQIASPEEVGQPEIFWNPGAAGLVLTCCGILERSIEEQYDSVLLLEDDVAFHPGTNERVEQSWPDIPADWELLYFGVFNYASPVPVTGRVARVTGGYHTHCWAVRHPVFALCLEEFRKVRNPIDVTLASLVQPRGKSYCFTENVAYQAAGYSDITNRLVEVKP